MSHDVHLKFSLIAWEKIMEEGSLYDDLFSRCSPLSFSSLMTEHEGEMMMMLVMVGMEHQPLNDSLPKITENGSRY